MNICVQDVDDGIIQLIGVMQREIFLVKVLYIKCAILKLQEVYQKLGKQRNRKDKKYGKTKKYEKQEKNYKK